MAQERYAPVRLCTQATPAFTCLDCGSVVLDQPVHDRWHHDLADTLAATLIEAVTDAIQGHVENAPHFYRDGSS